MPIDSAKKIIHQMANNLTAALGYLELMDGANATKNEEYIKKARYSLKSNAVLLRDLSQLLASAARLAAKTAKQSADEAERAAAALRVATQQTEAAKQAADAVAEKSASVESQLDDIAKTLPIKVVPIKRKP